MRKASLLLAPLAALALAGCGDSTAPAAGSGLKDAAKGAMGEAMQIVDESQVAELLSAEAKFALGAFEQDLRGEIAAYQAQFEHEATTSKISDDQMFYCMSRGLSQEEAVALIVNGLVRDVLQQLPMEFMAETQKLIGISLEGSVG